MSAPQTLDGLYKQIITACDGLRDDAQRRADFWSGLDAWLVAIDNEALKIRAGGGNAFSARLGMPDPQADDRPEAARQALLALHFGAPAGDPSSSARMRLKACVAHIAEQVAASGVLSADARVRQRIELAKAKLLVPKDPPPPDAQLATVGLIITSYRALRDAARTDPD
ncbi:MAG: hypothetical protein ACI9U2_001472 [Bradymonadia bacterium]